MRIFSNIIFLLASWCFAVGCSVQTAQVSPSSGVLPATSMDRAFATFVDVCYKEAPSFQSFNRKTRGYESSQNGWRNHASYDFSVVLREFPTHYSCQFTFSADEGTHVFASTMNTPFNARELTNQEVSQVLQNDDLGIPADILPLTDRIFGGKTDFDGRPAFFMGFIFTDQFSTSNGDRYGLALTVSK